MTTIDQGETETYRGADQYLVRVTSGEVGLGPSTTEAKRSIFTWQSTDQPIPYTPSDRHNTLVVAAIGGSATVDVQANEGFRIDLFATYNYSTAFPPARTERIPAEGTVEVNADITQTISSGGGTATSTVNADTDEVWVLRKVEVNAPDPDAGASGSHDIEFETESQGIQLAQADDAVNADTDLVYESGSWVSGNNTRADFENVRVDDNDGIKATYTNDSGSNQTSDITIRYKFDVIRA